MSKLRFLSVLVTCAILIVPNSFAASTKSPSPKPTEKSAAKAKPKSTVKSTKKTTIKSKTKTVPKKKVVYKPRPRKKVKLAPRQDAPWPPIGFTKKDNVYAKIPSAREVLDAATTDSKLRKQLNTQICEKMTCGAVTVAAEAGCVWWEITGDIIGSTSQTDKSIKKYGTTRSVFGGTIAEEIRTFLVVSDQERILQRQIVNIDASCHLDNPTDKIPS